MGAIKTEIFTAHEETTTIKFKETLFQPSTMRGPDYALLSVVLDIAATAMTFVFANLLVTSALSSATFWVLQGIGLAVWMIVFFSASVYTANHHYQFSEEIKRIFFAVLASALIFSGILFIADIELSRTFILAHAGLNIAMLFGWRTVMRVALRTLQSRRRHMSRRVLVIGTGEQGRRVASLIGQLSGENLAFAGFVGDKTGVTGSEFLGTIEADLHKVVADNHIDDVIVALPNRDYDKLEAILSILHTLPVQIWLVPRYMNFGIYQMDKADRLSDMPIINVTSSTMSMHQRMMKRAFDISVTYELIFMTLTVMMLVALAIKLEDPKGPILFLQTRIGENGRPFKIFKFRSMFVNADKMLDQVSVKDDSGKIIVHKRPDDPRVTRIGKLIRKTSLDELPQLFNVLRG
ncbi:MAG: sugar transferase, partial [Anaerolineae bacterium]|nr:sugar transferase [Anaerolineae bacterium]